MLQGDFEKLHEFKMFLRHLEKRGVATYEEHGEMIIGIANGEIQGHFVFSKFDKVDLSASYFENGAFLSIGHLGCLSEVSTRFGSCVLNASVDRVSVDTLGRYVDRQSADMSTDSRPICRPILDRYVGRDSVDISADCRSTRMSGDTL